MSTQVILNSPFGISATRDIADGRWAEAGANPEDRIGDGMWAIPGLVDAHAHLASSSMNFEPGIVADAKERALDALAAGVTLILDKGWTDETTMEVIHSVDEADRPVIEAAARIISVEGGYYPGFGRITSPSDLGSTVAGEAKAAAGWVKLAGDWPRRGLGPVTNFDESELKLVVKTAESLGSKVAIHTMAREAPAMAVAAGVHSIEHGLFLSGDDLVQLGARQGSWVPTVLRMEAIIDQLGAESSGGRLIREGLENVRRLLPIAVDVGVNVLAGTDLVCPPAEVAKEVIRLSEYGLRTEFVLEAASVCGFRSTGRAHEFDVGSPADAVLYPENPLDNLEILLHPAAVIRMGRVL